MGSEVAWTTSDKSQSASVKVSVVSGGTLAARELRKVCVQQVVRWCMCQRNHGSSYRIREQSKRSWESSAGHLAEGGTRKKGDTPNPMISSFSILHFLARYSQSKQQRSQGMRALRMESLLTSVLR